jgi:hypothetical protein
MNVGGDRKSDLLALFRRLRQFAKRPIRRLDFEEEWLIV